MKPRRISIGAGDNRQIEAEANADGDKETAPAA